MRRSAVAQGLQQEAELGRRFLLGDAEHLENGRLHVRVVNTHRTAADLHPVQHKVVGLRHGRAGIVLQRSRVGIGRGREGVVQGLPAVLALVPLEHRPVHHPQRAPAILVQIQIAADGQTQRTECITDHRSAVGAEENQIARFGSGALHDAGHCLVRQELENRRLQAVTAGCGIGHLDVGQTLGAVPANKLGVLINLLA